MNKVLKTVAALLAACLGSTAQEQVVPLSGPISIGDGTFARSQSAIGAAALTAIAGIE